MLKSGSVCGRGDLVMSEKSFIFASKMTEEGSSPSPVIFSLNLFPTKAKLFAMEFKLLASEFFLLASKTFFRGEQ